MNAPAATLGSSKLIREAIEVYIESLVAHGDPIPGPVEIERVTVAA